MCCLKVLSEVLFFGHFLQDLGYAVSLKGTLLLFLKGHRGHRLKDYDI